MEAALTSGSLNTIFGAVQTGLSLLQTFQNQPSVSSGNLGLDPLTVNAMLTVELKKKSVPVYDFTKAAFFSDDDSMFGKPPPPQNDAKDKNKGIEDSFNDLASNAVTFHIKVTAAQQRLSVVLAQITALTTGTVSYYLGQRLTGTDSGDPEVRAAYLALQNSQADTAAKASELASMDATAQGTVAALLGVSGTGTGAVPIAAGVGVGAGLVTAASPLAQALLAERYIKFLSAVTPGNGHAPLLLTCRLVSADATETTVKRFLVENYVASSAVSTIEVDGFDSDTGECKCACLIEGRGANMYWFSRVKTAAEQTGQTNLHQWQKNLFKTPASPQFAVTRKSSWSSSTDRPKRVDYGPVHDQTDTDKGCPEK
jgi:hypothetical protein